MIYDLCETPGTQKKKIKGASGIVKGKSKGSPKKSLRVPDEPKTKVSDGGRDFQRRTTIGTCEIG